MKFYFIPFIVLFNSSIQTKEQCITHENTSTIVWVSESIDEDEFLPEELLYETDEIISPISDTVNVKATKKVNKKEKIVPILLNTAGLVLVLIECSSLTNAFDE
jgi:hypothetical protein